MPEFLDLFGSDATTIPKILEKLFPFNIPWEKTEIISFKYQN